MLECLFIMVGQQGEVDISWLHHFGAEPVGGGLLTTYKHDELLRLLDTAIDWVPNSNTPLVYNDGDHVFEMPSYGGQKIIIGYAQRQSERGIEHIVGIGTKELYLRLSTENRPHYIDGPHRNALSPDLTDRMHTLIPHLTRRFADTVGQTYAMPGGLEREITLAGSIFSVLNNLRG